MYDGGMKFRKFLNDTADQIYSTLLVVFIGYSVVNGFTTLWKTPPKTWIVLVVMGVGFALGVVKYLKDENNAKDLKSKDNVED